MAAKIYLLRMGTIIISTVTDPSLFNFQMLISMGPFPWDLTLEKGLKPASGFLQQIVYLMEPLLGHEVGLWVLEAILVKALVRVGRLLR